MGLFGPRIFEAMGSIDHTDPDGTFLCHGVNAAGKVGATVRVYKELPGMRVDTSRYVIGKITKVTVTGSGPMYRVQVTERPTG